MTNGNGLSKSDENVIHVAFSGPRRGGRIRTERKCVPTSLDGDPVSEAYTQSEVSRLFGLSRAQLRYWDKTGFASPTGVRGRLRFYTFRDLIGIRAAKGLLDAGLSLRSVRRSVDALRATLPAITRPLAELRVIADGDRMVVQSGRERFEPATGQLLLDFETRALHEDVVRVLRPRPSRTRDRRKAYERYLEGCRLDEDEASWTEAERAYREAIALDATLSNAYTNLGNLRYRAGFADEAERLYREALGVDPSQPEAHYNLGYLLYERRQGTAALPHFRRAVALDPGFADARFNLAMVLEELGAATEARPHWEAFLRLDPEGPWAEVARKHLER